MSDELDCCILWIDKARPKIRPIWVSVSWKTKTEVVGIWRIVFFTTDKKKAKAEGKTGVGRGRKP